MAKARSDMGQVTDELGIGPHSNFVMFLFHVTKPQGYAIQHIPVPVPSQDNWEGCGRKGIRRKNGGIDGCGLLISPDRVMPMQIVGVSASCYPP